MDYQSFQKSIIEKFGDFYADQIDVFFTQSVEFAKEDKFEEAVKAANFALSISVYSNIGYEIIYLIGMLCQSYLDINQPEISNDFFNYGMKLIDEWDDDYEDDLNHFLDFKILIEDALREKNNPS